MRKTHRLIALLLSVVMLLGMIPTVTAVDGAPAPTGTTAEAEWEEIQDIISQYYGEWTDTSYPGAVNTRIPNTALLGNGDVGVSSAGSDTEKTFNISKGDFWGQEGNGTTPLAVGDISISDGVIEDDGNVARGTTVYTCGKHNNSELYAGAKMVDGYEVLGNKWCCTNAACKNNHWAIFDLGTAYSLASYRLVNAGAEASVYEEHNTAAFELQYLEATKDMTEAELKAATDWKTIASVSDNTKTYVTGKFASAVNARYVRLHITDASNAANGDGSSRVVEFQMFEPAVNKNLVPSYASYATSTQHSNLSAVTALDGSFVANGGYCGWSSAIGNPQWLMVDMGKAVTFNRWVVHNDGAARPNEAANNTKDCELQVWTGNGVPTGKETEGWTAVDTVTGNTANSIDRYLTENCTAQYLRLYVSKGTQETTNDSIKNPRARIAGFEIYNMSEIPEIPDDTPETTNVAAGSTIYVCAQHNASYAGTYMVDGKIDSSKWCCTNTSADHGGTTHWAIMDLKSAYTLTSYKLANSGVNNEANHNTVDFKIQYLEATEDMTEAQLKAATDWKDAVIVTGNSETYTTGDISEVTARYVRLYITKAAPANDHARIHELELYGYEGTADSGEEDLDPTPTPEPEETIAFNEKQDILNAKVVTRQNLCGVPVQIESWMSATNDLFVMEITSLAKKNAADVYIDLNAYVNAGRPTSASCGDDYIMATRSTNARASDPETYISKVAMATRIIGAEGTYESSADSPARASFNLPAGETVYVVTAVTGGGQTYTADGKLWEGRTEPETEALALLDTIKSAEDINTLRTAHQNWWKDYWMQSYISLDTSDEDLATLQKYYYAAQYELGCAVREGNVAAGLYGVWFTTDDANWNGDYHLNYNFISTYYGLATSNRVSMVLPAVEAIVNYMPQGIKNAASMVDLGRVCKSYPDFLKQLIDLGHVDPENGISDAILYPVSIYPFNSAKDYHGYLNETLDAPMSAYPLIEYYNFTQDKEFMEDTLYVYLKHFANFAEAWLIEEENKDYALYAGYNEGSWAKNAALELGAYKMCLKYAIQIGTELGEDADKLAKWQAMYEGLAEQPMVENYNGTGKTVLSLAEQEYKNGQWGDMATPVPRDGNCLPLESVIPFEVYGYYSSDEELQILQDTIDIFDGIGAWTQINNFPKLAANAVNARYDTETIVTKLAAAIRKQMKKNLMIDDNAHGIEKAGATEAINNMLLLSDKGVIKLFGNWLADKDASFTRLRASGAFVFSADYDGDTQEIVEGATMYSEAGATATVASLWDEGMIVLDESGNRVKTTKGTAPNHEEEITYTFETEAGKTYTFVKKTDISVTGVSLDKTEATLAEGETLQLTATVTPEDADDVTVSWASSDESVATVDQNGKVTATGKGEATITVITTDGDKTATCKVTVTVDTTAIDTAVAAANTAKTGIETSDKTAAEVDKDVKFVTTAEMKALTDAIAAAEAAKTSAKTTADVTAAVKTLNDAVETFQTAVKTGTYVEEDPVPDPVTITVNVEMKVENKTQPGITAEGFTIELYEGDTKRGTVETGETGKAGFQITYGAEDVGKTVEYKVSVKKGKTAGVTYDKTVHTIQVTIAQKDDGSLYTIINEKETDTVSVSFQNTYEKPATPVTGDNFSVILVGTIMLLSMAGVAALLMSKKQKGGKYAR